jgi:hypothetical protein
VSGAAVVLGNERVHGGAYVLVAARLCSGTRGKRGTVQRVLRGRAIGAFGQGAQFVKFLHGEGHPGANFRRQLRFTFGIDRYVQQRAGRCQHDARGPERCDGLVDQSAAAFKIVDPDIAAIDQPERERLLRCDERQRGGELLRRTHQVEVHACYRQCEGQRQVFFKGGEVGCQVYRQVGGCKLGKGTRVETGYGLGQVECEAWLVDLYAGRAGLRPMVAVAEAARRLP